MGIDEAEAKTMNVHGVSGARDPAAVRVPPVRVTPTPDEGASAYQAGSHDLVRGLDEENQPVVWKHNEWASPRLAAMFPQDGRRQDVREIVASHIVADYFGLPGITYQEGYYVDDRGRHDGVVSRDVGPIQTLQKPGEELPGKATVSDIRDPQTAVQISVVRAWLGDGDITLNDGNFWLRSDGSSISADYGQALQDGIKNMGLPYGNHQVMRTHASRETVEPVLDRIRNLSNQEIRDLVDTIGQTYIHDWTPAHTDRYAGILERNRNRMSRGTPYRKYYASKDYWVPQNKALNWLKTYPMRWRMNLFRYNVPNWIDQLRGKDPTLRP